jgi:putative transposase
MRAGQRSAPSSQATAACAGAGRHVIANPPAYTRQDGSGCGERVRKSMSVRTQVCSCGGLVPDRDENAAPNMLRAGQVPQARTWATGPSVA